MTQSTPEFRYEVILGQDTETNELILPIPPDLMRQMNWTEGDQLDFNQDDQGRWVISKVGGT